MCHLEDVFQGKDTYAKLHRRSTSVCSTKGEKLGDQLTFGELKEQSQDIITEISSLYTQKKQTH